MDLACSILPVVNLPLMQKYFVMGPGLRAYSKLGFAYASHISAFCSYCAGLYSRVNCAGYQVPTQFPNVLHRQRDASDHTKKEQAPDLSNSKNNSAVELYQRVHGQALPYIAFKSITSLPDPFEHCIGCECTRPGGR